MHPPRVPLLPDYLARLLVPAHAAVAAVPVPLFFETLLPSTKISQVTEDSLVKSPETVREVTSNPLAVNSFFQSAVMSSADEPEPFQ